MSLRTALEALAADMSWADGRRIMRVAAVLESKKNAPMYWRERGRQRFERELIEDGLDTTCVAGVLKIVDDVLAPAVVDLDDILADLRRRTS